MILPVITLYQPWGTWVMRRWKPIETRTHDRFKSLKGKTILIHAGMKTDDCDLTIKNPYLTWEQIIKDPDEIVNGYILGSAFVYDFKLLDSSHSKDALIDCGNTTRYGLFLKDVVKFDEPIPVKGEMGIWYYDLDRKEKVKKQNTETTNLFNQK
jgi:hypothetical protein